MMVAAERLVADGEKRVDLLLLHWPKPDVPFAETLGARDGGLARPCLRVTVATVGMWPAKVA